MSMDARWPQRSSSVRPYCPRTTLPGSQEPVVQMQECRLGKTSMVMSLEMRWRSPPCERRSWSSEIPASSRTRADSLEPITGAPVLAAMTSAPAMWSKCECPTRTASAREISSAVNPTSGASGTRSMYASSMITVSSTWSLKVAQPSQSRVTVMWASDGCGRRVVGGAQYMIMAAGTSCFAPGSTASARPSSVYAPSKAGPSSRSKNTIVTSRSPSIVAQARP